MEGDEVNITDASKKRIERLAAVHEPPAAWRASTMRHIADYHQNRAGYNVPKELASEGRKHRDWAEFLRQEADRVESE